MSAPSNWPRNRLLLALPSGDLKRLMPELEHIRCERGEVLIDADSPLDHVFFPDSGVISVVAVYADGNIIEMATIGREGCTCVQAIFGAKTPPSGCSCRSREAQRGCRARRSPGPWLDAGLSTPDVRLRPAFLEQVLVSVACNGAHSLKQRLARWLLMMRDRATTTRCRSPKTCSPRCWGPAADHHQCRPGAGACRSDRAWPAAGHDPRSAGPHGGVLRMLSTGPGAHRFSPSQDIRVKANSPIR